LLRTFAGLLKNVTQQFNSAYLKGQTASIIIGAMIELLHMQDPEVESSILPALTQVLESNQSFFSDCIVKHE
jgi:hypothetical protein